MKARMQAKLKKKDDVNQPEEEKLDNKTVSTVNADDL